MTESPLYKYTTESDPIIGRLRGGAMSYPLPEGLTHFLEVLPELDPCGRMGKAVYHSMKKTAE